ncbi:MAG: type II toxin-antitoxin system RelE/ParE family toxin [Flavobacteriales bacterium]|nr:type II toxin-antitoxin system RelE/ParE family toxin [Flavobacteriales bacterium]
MISRKAQESIQEIFNYVKKVSSVEIAQKVKSTIITECKNLSQFSGYSKERYLENLNGDFRSITVWDYNIIYSITQQNVNILNVIHTSTHPEKRKNI